MVEVLSIATIDRDSLVDRLDAVSAGADVALVVASAGGHRAYAGLLRRGGDGHSVTSPRSRFSLLLPDQIASGWAITAANLGLPLPVWIGQRIRSAPSGVVAWEAAAAERGNGLGEWIYANALRLATER
jgi:hypothetical protein